MDLKKNMSEPEYDFLRDHERLGKRIILMGLGGSYAYGTNNDNSDIDFRGITLQSTSDLLGMTTFEQYEDTHTDTVLYGFNKIVRLLLECNPNTIELLGLDENQYLIKTELGQQLLDNREMFLSKRAAKSFGGYASAQLRRLQNAIARDSMPQQEREMHILNSVRNAMEDFQRRSEVFKRGTMRIYIDDAENPEVEKEIFIDANYKHLPLRDYKGLLGCMNNVVRDYDKIGKRNHKKDDNHLNKHAMHLIRLFMMAIDILDKKEIRTHRTDDLDLLLAIRRGDFILKDYEGKVLFKSSIWGFGTRPYELVLPDLFPWADICVDYDFYTEDYDSDYYNMSIEDKMEEHTIFPYKNAAGEVDFYRLFLSVNELGKSFLLLDEFLNKDESYYWDKIV